MLGTNNAAKKNLNAGKLRKFLNTLFYLTLFLTQGVGTANADANKDLTSPIPQEEGLTLGAGVIDVNPAYIGVHNQVTPIPWIRYRNGYFFAAGITAGYALMQTQEITLAIAVRPRFNRLKASDSPQLDGIQERKPTLDSGVVLSWREAWGQLRIAAFHDVLNKDNGTSVGLGWGYPLRVGYGRLTPGLGTEWQSAHLTNHYYGVSPAESTATRPAYTPGSATNPYVSLFYGTPLSDHWRFLAGVRYSALAKSITQSPIVDKNHNLMLLTTIAYHF